jgi:hypothetical protein
VSQQTLRDQALELLALEIVDLLLEPGQLRSQGALQFGRRDGFTVHFRQRLGGGRLGENQRHLERHRQNQDHRHDEATTSEPAPSTQICTLCLRLSGKHRGLPPHLNLNVALLR